jgi:cephalosporin-C deacetylase-like acetyl esterase
MKMRSSFFRFVAVVLAVPALWLSAQSQASPREQMIEYLDSIARTQLEARSARVAAIHSPAEADRRKAAVRGEFLRLMGNIPGHSGPVQVKTFGMVHAEGFTVEKVAYESLPNFWVTANVYIPAAGNGPYPAIVVAPGHGAGGKTENWSWGGNFARNGIIALAYDPIGQGERLQYYDADQKKSFVGNPTGEHGEANIGPLLIGDNIASYMVNDAMRGVDYLLGRRDVDGSRIGAFGCSGGGTSTAYFAALDDRVKVAATACYITSFRELLPSPTGVQEAEQSIPHFIERGLDFADWVEAFAPKPYAVVSTMDDMFPFEGARQTVDEAKRFYALYGAEDRIQWITGPGGHGNLGPVSPAIMKFFTKNLKGSDAEPTFTPLRAAQSSDMIVMPSGQVSEIPGVTTVHALNRQRAATFVAKSPPRLRQDIRRLTGAGLEPGATHVEVTTKSTLERAGYRVETISMKSDGIMEVSGVVAIPDGKALNPAVLMLDSLANPDFDRLAQAGRIVMKIEARPTPPGTESIKSPYLGPFNLLALRAFLVGKSIIGLRIDDAIRAMDWLAARKDVDRKAIAIYGSGPMGMVALHEAVLDTRVSKVVVENTLASYKLILNQPVHRSVSEVVIPGVLKSYDTPDLLLAVQPRPVVFISPRDALGDALTEASLRSAMPEKLQRIQIQTAHDWQ